MNLIIFQGFIKKSRQILGEDPECHAAKLLEVIILQCKDKQNIDDMIPSFIEVRKQFFLKVASSQKAFTLAQIT